MGNLTVREVGQVVSRYKAFIVVIVVLVLAAIFLPGRGTVQDEVAETGDERRAGVGGPAFEGPDTTLDDGDVGDTTGGVAAQEPGQQQQQQQAAAPPPAQQTAEATGLGPLDHPDCDPETGRIRVPSRVAAPCVPPFEGDAGNTYQGVTSNEIVIAVPQSEGNEAVDAFLAAAGADDSDEEIRQQREEWAEFFETYYETYGRTVRFEIFDVSGEGDEAARADAIFVAEEVGAFASWGFGGHGTPYVDELVERGVLCFCTTSMPIENYHRWAPYVWSTLMASTEAYVHRAEYIGKRLWGDPAEHAGDAALQLETRRIALIYFEDEQENYKAGADFFEQELTKYGAHLDDRIAYLFDLPRAQEQARTIIGRLQDRGITSIVFAGDPFYPAFFTQEATNQRYFPEWIVSGSALTDTNFFARTYDRQQWSNAFGVSMLTVDLPEPLSEAHRLFTWHFGREPTAGASYSVMYPTPWIFFTGVHLAGPNLTPETFRDGLFSYPSSPEGDTLTLQKRSFGQTVWPWDSYTAYDDTTELWWDPLAQGEDEIGNYGVGMYQYVNDGLRYNAGEWPDTVPDVFNPSSSVTTHEEIPPSDRPPQYEPKPREPRPGSGG